jgi:Flp pilus assembly protein TadG
MRLRAAARRLCGRRGAAIRGAAAVEFAFIAPILILMVVGVVDFGMGIYRKMQVQNAAQAGAQYAMLHGFSPSISTAVTAASTYAGITASPAPTQFCGCPTSSGVTTAACSSNCADGSVSGSYVSVSSQGGYQTILPYPMIPNSFTFSAQSTVRVQ